MGGSREINFAMAESAGYPPDLGKVYVVNLSLRRPESAKQLDDAILDGET
jgi:hypothetical protein